MSTTKWKQYPEYKISGIKWESETPTEWKKVRLRFLGKTYGGLTGKKGEDFSKENSPNLKPYIPYTNILNQTYISKNHFDYVFIDEGEKQNLAKAGDLFFLMSSESYQDLGKSSILIDHIDELYLNSFCKGFRISESMINPLFLNYQLQGHLHKQLICIEGKGFTRINLSQERLLDTPIFIPSPYGQDQITKFLDKQIPVITKSIENLEKTITILEEERSALTKKAVTKGFDPEVGMVESGIEWLGKVPSHWTVKRMRFLCDITTGGRDTQDAEDEGEFPFFVRSPYIERISTYSFDGEAVLTSGDGAGVGKIYHHYIGKLDFHQRVYLFSSFNQINGRLFYHYLKENLETVVLSLSAKSTVDSIRMPMLKNFPIVYGPEEEQMEILNHIEKVNRLTNQLVEKTREKIRLLKEYRTALISAAVTGKIDVRGYTDG